MPFLASSQTRTGTANGGTPLYLPNVSESAVLSLNGLTGVVNVTSADDSVGVLAGGGSVDLSTTGKAIAPSTVTASGAISGASLALTGEISSGAITSTGKVRGDTLEAAGTLTTYGGAIINNNNGVGNVCEIRAPCSARSFTNTGDMVPVPFSFAQQAYNAGLSASLVTVLPAAVAGLSAFKILKLSVSGLNIGVGGGSNTYWWAITNGLSTTQANANIISANSVKFFQTLVNAGVTTYTFDVILPYTSATWPASGLMFFINASGGGDLSMTASIVGVL